MMDKSVYLLSFQSKVSFKHATQISAGEVLLVKTVNMHGFLCYRETKKQSSEGGCFCTKGDVASRLKVKILDNFSNFKSVVS